MTNQLDYDQLFEDALRDVVRTVLQRVAEEGLPGEHHFYISFRTDQADVEIPDHLRSRYPDEMTIVLQNQFWDLRIADELFEVTLSFNNIQEQVIVPFAAITSLVDPSVRFGLQFRGGKDQDVSVAPLPEEEQSSQPPLNGKDGKGAEVATNQTGDDQTADVIPLDTFRKK